ncbi:hypothetical protein [Archangium violaceum]|uniref:hypothetical protein n=1 Tax=Archangium violaceum TaxID=83451 RepID=UPI0036DAC734
MKRELRRSAPYALLAGMMLVACGAPEEGGLAPSEDVGTKGSAICSGSSVSALSLAGFSSWGGEAAGSGNWTVTYPANGVHVDYYIDGTLRGSSDIQGDANRSGTWNFSYSPVNCGSHSFQAKAYPITINSTGTIDRCPTSGTKTVTTSFSQSCPTASISCSRPVNTHILNCTGTGSGGSGGPYTYHWQVYAQPYNEPSYYSSWYPSSSSTTSITCPYHNWDPPYDLGRISLKVSDSSGLMSGVVTGEAFPCIAGIL